MMLENAGTPNGYSGCAVALKIIPVDALWLWDLVSAFPCAYRLDIEHNNIGVGMFLESSPDFFHITIAVNKIIVREQADVSAGAHQRRISAQADAQLLAAEEANKVVVLSEFLPLERAALIDHNRVALNVHPV